MKKSIIFILAFIFILPSIALARVGVGVGIGKIEIDKPLKPGGVYDLTSLVVLNTGDEASDYEITVAYQSEQPEFRPDKEWFSFSPVSFNLKPGAVQSVGVKLTLPVKVKPGDYFGYLQGQPKVKTNTAGGAAIGVAAATKLYFTVAPANFLQGLYYRTTFFLARTAPWSYVILGVILAAIIIVFLRRFISFDIGVSLKKK
jgi:hypothetical protein